MSPTCTPELTSPERWHSCVLPVVAMVLLAAPALVLPYLPMTDLPQHLATAAIMHHIDDPGYGFGQFYEIALDKTLYLLPYLLVLGLAQAMPLEMAMRCVVFLCLLVYPLGVLTIAKWRGRPAFSALLALPLVFNGMVFWGFIHFTLAVGLAYFSLPLFACSKRTIATDLALTVLCVALCLTHLYGPALLLGYAFFWCIFEERRQLVRRLLPLAPCPIAFLLWLQFAAGAREIDVTHYPSLLYRLEEFENSVLGGYQDSSEAWILGAFGLVFLFFSLHALPWSRQRWSRLCPQDRIFYAYGAMNLVLYMTLPLNLPTAKWVSPRHAVIALGLLPLLVPPLRLVTLPRTSKVLLVSLAFATLGNTWYHLLRFDYEAYGFEDILANVGPRPKLTALTFEKKGQVCRSYPYLHFAAYIQAEKGGLCAVTFAAFAWVVPVRERKDAGIPPTEEGLEWNPDLFDYRRFGYFFDHVLVRGGPADLPPTSEFPYELAYQRPPWRLMRAMESPPPPVKPRGKGARP